MKYALPITIGFLLLSFHATGRQVHAQDNPTVVANGFNGPMGVLVTDSGVWIVDSGFGGDNRIEITDPNTGMPGTVTFGETARVLRVETDGSLTEIGALPSMTIPTGEAMGGGRIAALGGSVYATSGGWGDATGTDPGPRMASVVRIGTDGIHEVTNAFAFEKTNNPDGNLVESNPFGLIAGPDGKLWMTDAAANTLLKLDPETGEMELVAVFGPVPSPIPNPNHNGKLETDAVPTGLAFGADGSVFVAILPGFPLMPGHSKIVRIDPDGAMSDYATNLTTIVDLRVGPDGQMYAVSFARFTDQGPEPMSGAVLRIREGEVSEVVLSSLSFPTSIDFNEHGDAYVTTNGFGAPGSGELLAYRGLAAVLK
jgi:sugar lactone lactonase YvrE